jgi:hypothetical protein
MQATGSRIIGMEHARGRRPRIPQRARLGKTWQDRSWRQKLIDQNSSGMFQAIKTDSATNHRALPSRH